MAVVAAALLIGLALALIPFRAYLRSAEGRPAHRRAALAAVGLFTAAGVGAYAVVGQPTAADTPYAEAHAAREALLRSRPLDEVIAERGRREPQNPEHPYFSGQYRVMLADQLRGIGRDLRVSGEADEADFAEKEAERQSAAAIQDLQRALRLAPRDPRIMIAVADMLSLRPNGPPPMVIGSLYAEAMALLPPDDPRRPRINAAMAALQQRIAAIQAPAPATPPGR
jgi:hypothetical protein